MLEPRAIRPTLQREPVMTNPLQRSAPRTAPRAAGRRATRQLSALAAAGLATGAVLLCGCGSSKPAYCAQVANFEKSVQALGNLNLASGTSGLTATLENVDSSAKALEAAVKSELGPQVAAVKSSVVALGTSAKQLAGLPKSQLLTQAATTLPAEVSAVKAAVSDLQSATKSKCQ